MKYLLPIVFCALAIIGSAQENPQRFKEEIEALQEQYDTIYSPSEETIVFTGSSSIRMWKDVNERFSEQQVVNTGFGGSQASDLAYYIYDLILRFNPKKVFIYEGDNDIFANKNPNDIRNTIKHIINGIQRNDSTTQVVLIAAKPSLARWNLNRKYKRLNRKLEQLAEEDPAVAYADVWHPMLDGNKVKQDIFIGDGLHMNNKGYQIWYEVIEPFMN